MSLIQQFRDKVSGYEGFAQAWIVSRKVAMITHGSVWLVGVLIGRYLKAHGY